VTKSDQIGKAKTRGCSTSRPHMFLYNRFICWLIHLLYYRTFSIAAFFRRLVMGGQAPVIGRPGSILDTDLYKVK
jgi:hypothetical protein